MINNKENFENSALVDLPGKRIYKKDIRISTFSLLDIQEIALIRVTGDEEKLYNLLDRKLDGISIDELTNQDAEYLMHWQRVNSYTHFPLQLEWSCASCSHKNCSTVTGDDLVITKLNPDYNDFIDLQLYSNKVIRFRIGTVGDNKSVRKYMKENNLDIDDVTLKASISLAHIIDKTDNGSLALDERIDFVRSMSPDDYLIIEEANKLLDFGVRPFVNKSCSNCSEEFKIGFKFTLDKFFPSIPSRPDIRNRILFNQASKDKPSSDGLREGNMATGPSPKNSSRARKQGNKEINEFISEEKIPETKKFSDIVQ